jgi:hypothetical protein
MTIASVASAIAQGYSISKIIKSVLNMNTPLAKSIKEALKQGYNEDQIGEYLSKGKNLSFSQKNQMLTGMTEEEKARGIAYRQTKSEKNIGNILKTGAAAIPVAAAGYAAGPMLGSALGRAAPSIFGPGAIPGAATTAIGGIPPAGPPPGTTPQNTINVQGTRLPPNAPPGTPPISPVAQTQPQQVTQPKAISIDTNALLDKLKATSKIDDLLKAGNDAEGVEAYFRKFAPQVVKKAEDEAGRDFFQIIREYEDSKGKGVTTSESKAALQETAPIEKNATVSTPQGIGEVLEIRNGQAIVDVDGKKHKVSEDELLSSPIPEKDLADLYEDLLRGIEAETGEEVSKSINVVGFDPDNNSVIVTFNNGDQYSYDNLDEEEQREALELEGLRKTSGRTHIGAYQEGTKSPAGNRIQAFIKKLQAKRGGKGNEYAKHYKPVYSRLGPAEEAHKVKFKPKSKKKKPHEEE